MTVAGSYPQFYGLNWVVFTMMEPRHGKVERTLVTDSKGKSGRSKRGCRKEKGNEIDTADSWRGRKWTRLWPGRDSTR